MSFARPVLAALALLVLSACTSIETGSSRSNAIAWDHKLGPTTLLYVAPASLPIRITKSGGFGKPTITEEDMAAARSQASALLNTFRGHALPQLQQTLVSKGLVLSASAAFPQTTLRVMPVAGVSTCAPGCTHDIVIVVSAIDQARNAEIWRAQFNVGLTSLDKLAGAQVDPEVVKSFVNSVVMALQRERFI